MTHATVLFPRHNISLGEWTTSLQEELAFEISDVILAAFQFAHTSVCLSLVSRRYIISTWPRKASLADAR